MRARIERLPLSRPFSRLPVFLLCCLLLSAFSCAHRPPPVPPPPASPPPAPRAMKVGIALGAGAAKGFAHIGVIKVLESHRIPVHVIAGTSAGSLVGALHAYGYDGFTLQKIALAVEKGEIADLTIPDNGFVKGERLAEYVNRMVRNTPIEKLRTPFVAVATDIRTGEEVAFSRGDLGAAVRASCSIPGVFRPVRIGDRVYVDGGVASPVPVDALRRAGADVVIAVDVSGEPGGALPQTTMETILQSVNFLYGRVAAFQLPRADVVIRPKVGHIASGDFTKRNEAILEGEKAAVAALPEIRKAVERAAAR